MFSNKVGSYPIDGLSTLGEAKVRIQDSRYYQQFAYEVQVGAGLSQYINELRKAVHPSGFNVFGKVTIASTVTVLVLMLSQEKMRLDIQEMIPLLQNLHLYSLEYLIID